VLVQRINVQLIVESTIDILWIQYQ
jgi:hypothetical protein